MPRSLIPVVVPVRYADAIEAAALRIDAVADSPGQAIDTARLLAQHWLRLAHPGRSAALGTSGSAGAEAGIPHGPHAYVLDPAGISTVQFPSRFDSESGERLGETLARLDERAVFGVALDCTDLVYINTVGLTGIASHLKRLSIHLVAVPPAIARVFDIVGMTRFLNLHETLAEALAAIPAEG